MNNTFKLLTFLIFSITTPQLWGSTVVKGSFSNDLNDSLKVYGVKAYPELNIPDKEELVIKDFRFSFELNEAKEIELRWKDGSIKLFVEPEDQLDIVISSNKELTYSGKGSANNDFLKHYHKRMPYDPAMYDAQSTMDGVENMLFVQRKDRIKISSLYKKQSELSGDLKSYYTAEVNYGYWSDLVYYSLKSGGFDSTLKVKQIPGAFFASMNPDIIKAQKKDIFNFNYRLFLTNWCIYNVSKERGFSKFDDIDQMVRQVSEYARINGGKIQSDYVSSFLLIEYLNEINAKTAQIVFPNISDEKTKALFTPILGKLLTKKVKLPKPKKEKTEAPSGVTNLIPDIKLLDMDSNEVSLRSFKKKIMYIDFWASWCGPCRGQMPHSKKLKEKFTKKELKKIVFVYVSIDTKFNTWINAVNKYDVGGSHLLSNKGWKSKICAELGIRSIPRYMIVGKKGEIIQKSAQRPSSPTLVEELKKLL